MTEQGYTHIFLNIYFTLDNQTIENIPNLILNVAGGVPIMRKEICLNMK